MKLRVWVPWHALFLFVASVCVIFGQQDKVAAQQTVARPSKKAFLLKPAAPAAAEQAPKDEATVLKKLVEPTEYDVTTVPLGHIVKYLSTRHEVAIKLDAEALKSAGIDADVEITGKAQDVTLDVALKGLLKEIKLVYVIRDGGVIITTPASTTAEERTKVDEASLTAAAEANVDPLEQQFLPQFRQVLKAELSFVNVVCKPTKEQRKPIELGGEKSLKAAVKEYADVQKKMMQGRAGGIVGYPDPRKLIQAGLAKSVQESLSAAQAAQYQAETDKRKAHLKRVAVQNLVAKLDEELVLTSAQRVAIVDSLSSNFQETWVQSLEMFMYGGQFLPHLPDNLLTPILHETQMKVWNAKPKNQNVFFGGFGFGGFVVEEALEPAVADEPAGAPQLDPDEKKAKE